MARSARIKTKAITIDTAELKKSMKTLNSNIQNHAADLAEKSLQAQIDAINDASAERFSKTNVRVSSGTVDRPLQNARVVRRTTGKGRIVVYVSHNNGFGGNLFNILDAGRNRKRARETFIFPEYEGETIPELKSELGNIALGNPEAVTSVISPGNVALLHDLRGDVKVKAIKKGKLYGGFNGKGLYRSSALWVRSELAKGIYVNGRKIKLQPEDIQVEVSKSARYKDG